MRQLFRPPSLAIMILLSAAGLGSARSSRAGTWRPQTYPIIEGLRVNKPLPVAVSHVIVVGDSISSGVGASGPGLSYASLAFQNDATVYPFEAGRDLSSYFGPNLTYVNIAHSGDTTSEVRHIQLPLLIQDAALGGIGKDPIRGHVIVMMTVGGNDLQSSFRPNSSFTGIVLERSLENLGAIVDFFEDAERFPDGVSLFLGNIYDITDGEDQAHACLDGLAFPGLSNALDAWSDAYRQVANTRKITLVDALSAFRGHGFNYANPYNPYFDPRDPTLWVLDRDCVHPNNHGHHMLRRMFMRQIADHFGLALTPSRL